MNNINRVQIGPYEINQPFYHQYDEINSVRAYFTFNVNSFYSNGFNFIPYVLIVIDTEENLEKSELWIRFNGKDIVDRQKYIYYNKLYPLEYEKSYDDETNLLLGHMVRTNIPNILFIPLDIIMEGNIQIVIFSTIKSARVDFYFNLSKKTQLYISNGAHLDKRELIDQYFNGNPHYGKISNCEISRHSNTVNNFYLKLNQTATCKHIKNYYKLYKKLVIEYGGNTLNTIPFDYIVLYLKVIKNIYINTLSIDNRHIIPINLKELINLNNIPLCAPYDLKIILYPNDVSKFHYNTRRHIKCDNINLGYFTYINYIPVELWNVILEYLDCRDLLNVIETCKFFYSLVPQNKTDDLYNTHKISVENLSLNDAIICTVYHKNNNLNDATSEFQLGSKSIIQHEITVSGQELLFKIDKLASPIDYIIIEFDIAGQYDILDMTKTTNIINGVITDLEFYSKMHNPRQNRYVIYFDVHADDINFVFAESVYCKAHIYAIYNINS
jgi:hypothetical protein